MTRASAGAPAVAAVDIGTTSTRAAIIDSDGRVLGSAGRRHPLLISLPPRAEQDPNSLIDSAIESLLEASEQAVGAEVAALSLSATMHSILGVDDEGEPLTPLLTWADNRAADCADELRALPDAHELYGRTGTPLHAMSPLVKLRWFKSRSRDIHSSVARWISIKEYFTRRMLGSYVIDHATASATGLFDIRRRSWDPQALELAGVRPGNLSELVPTTAVVGELDRKWAGHLGLKPGIPVVAGATDGVLENVGAAATRPGTAALTIGTSGAVRAATLAPALDDGGRLFCYVLTEDRWVSGGPVNNGGIALDWLVGRVLTDIAAMDDPYGELERMAAVTSPGAGGLIFLPYLLGERAPQWDSHARGVFFGLDAAHDRADLVRAVMEGVVQQIYLVYQLMNEVVGPTPMLRATGGFARSPTWRQIVADVFGLEVTFPSRRTSASCIGAAVLGMVAVEIIESIDEGDQLVFQEHSHAPDAGAHDLYAAGSILFGRLYDALSDLFLDLSPMKGTKPPGAERP